jgi:hypothetical protein
LETFKIANLGEARTTVETARTVEPLGSFEQLLRQEGVPVLVIPTGTE